MKDLADRSRGNVETRIRKALTGASLEKVTYAITYWELVFLAQDDVKLMATEILLPDQTSTEEESKQAVRVGSLLLALTNRTRVAALDVHSSGDLVVGFSGGESIRIMAEVTLVDWTWSIETSEFRFVCDGPLES